MQRAIAIIIVLSVIIACYTAGAEDKRVFILCNPESCVNVRKTPKKGSEEIGRLDFGDWVITDGKTRNGFLHVIGVTEYGEGWIHKGYVVDDQPIKLKAWATVTATGRVMSWKRAGSKKNGWVKLCTDVRIYAISEEWAVTSRGYIKTKYLEVWYGD